MKSSNFLIPKYDYNYKLQTHCQQEEGPVLSNEWPYDLRTEVSLSTCCQRDWFAQIKWGNRKDYAL